MPMLKALLCGAMSLAMMFGSSTPALALSAYHHPLIELVKCMTGTGSAFIAQFTYVSVHHVSRHKGCKIQGQPLEVVHSSPELDFSIVAVDVPGRKGIPFSCDPLREGEWYWAVGHAKGNPVQRVVALRFLQYEDNDGMAIFAGFETVIPGMSGGAVLNARGEAVATINAYSPFFGLSFGRALHHTELCNA
jgi:hypothetical protein